MHVLVTGGAGFIGSNVAASYVHEGHRVTVFDNLSRPGSERNLAWLRSQPGADDRLQHVLGIVRDAELVRSVVGAADVDLVFHFAAQTAVTTSLVDPRDDMETNVGGTFNVLEAVRQSEARTPPAMFFTSTNKVYGGLEHRPTREIATRYRFVDSQLHEQGISESEPLDFHSPYGCSKGAADQYVRDYARIYGLRTVVFRMSCIYGTRQFGNEDQGWVAHFLISVATGRPLTIYGTGKQVRDLLFIEDLVAAFHQAAEHIDTTAGHVYNIGGGPPNTLSIWPELQPRLNALAGRPVVAQMEAWRPGDQPVYVTDSRAAGRDFGWRPKVSVDEGLSRLWDWIADNRALFGQPATTVRTNGVSANGKHHPKNGVAVEELVSTRRSA